MSLALSAPQGDIYYTLDGADPRAYDHGRNRFFERSSIPGLSN